MTPSGKIPREYELKLSCTVHDLAAFKRAVNSATRARLIWQAVDLETHYFDTPEQRFFKNGITIRVRRANGNYIQTIKAGRGGGGAMDRAEWEQPVNGEKLELETIPKAARRKIGTVSESELHEMVSVKFHRHKTVIQRSGKNGPDLKVEAALDKGVVQAGEKTQRFAECELELLQGEPEEFYRLIKKFHDACPLRLSRTKKSDRGFALLNNAKVRGTKLPKFNLSRTLSVSQTLSEIFNGCIGNIIDNEAAALDGKDPEGVHQMRVSLRRIRSSLSAFHRSIEPMRVVWLKRELQWLGSSLVPAREWDVFLMETLANVEGYGIDQRAMKALAALAKQRQRAGYKLVRATLKSDRYTKLILRLTGFAATGGWLPEKISATPPLLSPINEHARSILDHPYRKLIKAGKGLKSQTPAQRHQARIKLKNLRYTVDLLGSLYSNRNFKLFRKKMARLQSQFGRLNDVAQTSLLIEELMRPSPNFPQPNDRAQIGAGIVLGWHAYKLHDLEQALFDDWTAFRSIAPPWRLGKTKT
jgi:triphosphatase